MLDVSTWDKACKVYETLFIDSPDAIALCDRQQVVIKINPSFTRLFGYTEEDAAGRPLDEILTPTPQMKDDSDRLTSGLFSNDRMLAQTIRARKDGSTIPVSVLGLAYRTSKEDFLMFWSYRDNSPAVEAGRRIGELEHRFEEIFDSAPFPIFALGKDSRVLYVNEGMVNLSGKTKSELLGLPLSKFAGTENRERALRNFREIAEGKVEFTKSEFSLPSEGEKKRRGMAHGFPLRNRLGEFEGMVCFLEDITEKWQAEQELSAERNKYHTLFELDPIPKYLLDFSDLKAFVDSLKDHGIKDFSSYFLEHPEVYEICRRLSRLVDLNQAARKEYPGVEKESICGALSRLPGKSRSGEVLLRVVQAIANGEMRYTYEEIRPPLPNGSGDFRFFLNTWTVVAGSEETYSRVFVSMQEISELKKAHWKLEEQERQYRTLFENAGEGILGLSREGLVQVANPKLEEMLGYTRGGIEGKAFLDFVVPAMHKTVMACFRVVGQGSPHEIDLDLLHRKGTPVPTHVKAAPAGDGTSGEISCVGLFEDRRQIKKVEQKLRDQSSLLRKVWHQTIAVLSTVVEARDPYTAGHQRRVRQLALAISREMDLNPKQRAGLNIAALVHDIGKISIPSEILSKPGPLTPIELRLIKEHSRAGYEILSPIDFPWPIAEIVYQHHEAIDGSGYPRELKGGEILLEARILAVADTVEAISSHRPYRPALGTEYALRELQNLTGLKYDPDVVAACCRVFENGFAWTRKS
jgi:PAS domain S-box-containing protein